MVTLELGKSIHEACYWLYDSSVIVQHYKLTELAENRIQRLPFRASRTRKAKLSQLSQSVLVNLIATDSSRDGFNTELISFLATTSNTIVAGT